MRLYLIPASGLYHSSDNRTGIDLDHGTEHVELFKLAFDRHRGVLELLLVERRANRNFVEQIGRGQPVEGGVLRLRFPGQRLANGNSTSLSEGTSAVSANWQMGISSVADAGSSACTGSSTAMSR